VTASFYQGAFNNRFVLRSSRDTAVLNAREPPYQIAPASEVFTGTAATSKQPGYATYDHAEGEHKFRLVAPNGLAVFRRILVAGPYFGGDSRDFLEHIWYREFLNLHGFAFLGVAVFQMQYGASAPGRLQRLR
jgi:hypothetical protein